MKIDKNQENFNQCKTGFTLRKKMKKKPSNKAPSSKTATSTATKTATATKTSTDAYTQGNITVTGGAGKGATNVKIAIPGLASASQKKDKSKGKK